ncbi:MAG: holo-ACP synthase [Endomicrobiia bacterium]|nr:holo-ACP synthase [Endomicrobiaceae bacterium]MDD3053214.1 holo-ACP synthase [Endomicrobiaceae bacterium]MDD3922295.1 holo-ACP synthase [Endomicrobiaceae bacterium]MDD5102091.1 holo-ACP synthase [Endomicrobiaceae bacterium]
MKIGIDIEEVKRFSKLVKDDTFLKRIFSQNEIDYCLSKKNLSQHFAVRFAGKEAVWKAINSKKNISITDISFKNIDNGKPEVYIKNKRISYIDISFSHTKNTVVAVAIVSK